MPSFQRPLFQFVNNLALHILNIITAIQIIDVVSKIWVYNFGWIAKVNE